MCIISSLTLLSSILGPPSALIGFADKFSDWIDEEKYRRNVEYMHAELLYEFFTVQERSKTRLEKYIDDSDFSDADKNEYRELRRELRQNDAIYRFTH